MKIGKGKPKKKDDGEQEDIKLKKIPIKPGQVPEEATTEKPEKQTKTVKEPTPGSPVDINLGKLAPFDFEPTDIELEKPEPIEKEPREKEGKKPKKTKYTPKEKVKPSLEEEEINIIKGVPKKPEEVPEEDVKFRYAQKPLPEEDVEKVVLKPFTKPVSDTDIPEKTITPTEPISIKPEAIEPESDTEKPSETEKTKHKHKKIKKVPHKETIPLSRKSYDTRKYIIREKHNKHTYLYVSVYILFPFLPFYLQLIQLI